MSGTTGRAQRGELFEQMRRLPGLRPVTDAELDAQLEKAWRDLQGSVVSEASLPEMTVRLTMARLKDTSRR